jgi:hypothetical protein
MLEVVSITEGAFLTDTLWNLNGTLFVSVPDAAPAPPDVPQTSVIMAGFLLPAANGSWLLDCDPVTPKPPFPNTDDAADNTIATIRFRAIKQIFPETLCCNLTLYPLYDETNPMWLLDRDGGWIPVNETRNVNGLYCITTDMPGAMIDVYTQYPAPFGGQGPHKSSDMFWPQKEVILCANVTYNYWPVQHKIVGFEIEDAHGAVVAKLTAITDEDGVACTSFRIPWPCDDAEYFFGVWTVTATVDVACTVYNDTLTFHYDYLVEFLEVTIEGGLQDEGEWFCHCNYVKVIINYGTHAQQYYPALISVVIKDTMNVPICIGLAEKTVGGATFCQYYPGYAVFNLHIPKHAFVGTATIHINCFDKDPTEGGMAWVPEYGPDWPGVPTPTIVIQPC